ncbi:spermidine synthase [Streptomyces marispadix]|uniref:Spermidine synthase n=1 Tax=Streptomyces marispadix TaxID=2922868 RepID=A0ABS9T229_9ACTN|nr:spermidine synthase [Streptomyces marispadix]MCH6162518.1 spermidine synthase [Streptomyces marispadix]
MQQTVGSSTDDYGTGRPVVLDRRDGPHGEVVLRRHGELLQIIANGTFLMDTSDGRSERLLVRAALAELRRGRAHSAPRRPPRLLIGGLGVGFSLAEAAEEPEWGHITVVEREEAVVDWHRHDGPLSALTAAALRDPRTEIVHADLGAFLRGEPGPCEAGRGEGTAEGGGETGGEAPRELFDALCLDVDNGPGWTVTDDNASLYSPGGLSRCLARMAPGGVLAVWSAQSSPTFEDALRNAGFQGVRTEEIPVARGVPDVVHFATKPA